MQSTWPLVFLFKSSQQGAACSSNCLENYIFLGIKYQVQNFGLFWFDLKLGIFNKPGFAVVRDLLSLQMAKFYCKSCDLLGRESQHPRPVGRNCRLNSSAPVGEMVQETSQSCAAE